MGAEPDSMTVGSASLLDVEVVLDDVGWGGCVEDPQGLCRDVLAHAARKISEMVDGPTQVSVLLTGDERVRKLNAEFRHQDKPTNVLSFPSGDEDFETPAGPAFLGDIAIALETVRREADAAGKPVEHHLAHLAVHGFLHLLGYDHVADSEAEEMETLEREILSGLDIPAPY